MEISGRAGSVLSGNQHTHYASDVLGGALTGVVAALMVRATYKEGTKPDRLITSIL